MYIYRIYTHQHTVAADTTRFTGLMEEEASPFHNKHHKRGGKDISGRDFEQGDLKASVESVAKG